MARPLTAHYKTPVNPSIEDIMTLATYLDCIKDGNITDFDGTGRAAKDGFRTEGGDALKPSQGLSWVPVDCTHVVWFNK